KTDMAYDGATLPKDAGAGLPPRFQLAAIQGADTIALNRYRRNIVVYNSQLDALHYLVSIVKEKFSGLEGQIKNLQNSTPPSAPLNTNSTKPTPDSTAPYMTRSRHTMKQE